MTSIWIVERTSTTETRQCLDARARSFLSRRGQRSRRLEFLPLLRSFIISMRRTQDWRRGLQSFAALRLWLYFARLDCSRERPILSDLRVCDSHPSQKARKDGATAVV